MLTLPIKRKWFDMILAGEKTEEYREVSDYYTTRFRNLIWYPYRKNSTIENRFREVAASGGVRYADVILRNGYKCDAPAVRIGGCLMIREGKPEWGAEPGREYYVLTIESLKVLRSPFPAKNKGGQNNEDV